MAVNGPPVPVRVTVAPEIGRPVTESVTVPVNDGFLFIEKLRVMFAPATVTAVVNV